MKDNLVPIIHSNGNILYLTKDYEYHRTDGPAFEKTNGYKAWYLNGELHREDGPAIEPGNEPFPHNVQQWWYQGKYIPVSNLKEFQSYIRNKPFW
jgi:hypothetical protein